MRLAAGVEYCGSEYDGWQRQPGHRTVQESLERALSMVANHEIEVCCAGRTDAGVHALQQVIHFDSSSERENHSWLLGTNSNLPDGINLNWVRIVPDDFHARFSVISRKYRYYILNRPTRTALFRDRITWQLHRLDENRMQEAAEFLIGKHDFTSYRASACQSKSPVRQVTRLLVNRYDELLMIEIEANAFLHHMVRNIAGVLMMIGMGKHEPCWAQEVLNAKDRTLAGVTASPNGLYLAAVKYPEMYGIPHIPHTDKFIARVNDVPGL